MTLHKLDLPARLHWKVDKICAVFWCRPTYLFSETADIVKSNFEVCLLEIGDLVSVASRIILSKKLSETRRDLQMTLLCVRVNLCDKIINQL